MGDKSSRPRLSARMRGAALTAAALLALSLGACQKKEGSAPQDKSVRGRALYMTYCIACHNPDPSKDGSLGPMLRGASLDLLKAKVKRGEYPPGYTPKRPTRIMQILPVQDPELEAIHAFLNSSP